MDAALRAHGYDSEYQRHRDNAWRALEHAKQHVDRLLADWGGVPSSSLTYGARQLNASAAEFGAEVQALLTLHEVRQNLKAEHDEGWQEGHGDGLRDAAAAERFEDRRRNQEEQAARAAGTSATEAGEKE